MYISKMRRSAAPSYRNVIKRPRFIPAVTNSILGIDSEIDFSPIESSLPESCFFSDKTNNLKPNSTESVEKKVDDGNILRSSSEILDLILSTETEENHASIETRLSSKLVAADFEEKNVSSLQIPNNFQTSNKHESAFKNQEIKDSSKIYECETIDSSKIYSVLWCKRSSKKHKVWEGDGLLVVSNRSAVLKNMDGKEIDRGIGYRLKEIQSLTEGSKFYIGGKECEVQYEVSQGQSAECSNYETSSNSELPMNHDNTKKKPVCM